MITAVTIFFIANSICNSAPLELKDNDSKTSIGSNIGTFAFALPAVAILVNNHEIGHTLFAKVLGDRKAHYSLLDAETFVDTTKLTKFGNTLLPLGGVLFSELLAEGYDQINRYIEMPDWLHRLLAVGYLVTKLDIGLQTYQILGKHETNTFDGTAGSRPDFVEFTFYISNGNKKYLTLSQIGFCSIFALDVALSIEKFRRNWEIAIGKMKYSNRSE